jgi:hypothetical protein
MMHFLAFSCTTPSIHTNSNNISHSPVSKSLIRVSKTCRPESNAQEDNSRDSTCRQPCSDISLTRRSSSITYVWLAIKKGGRFRSGKLTRINRLRFWLFLRSISKVGEAELPGEIFHDVFEVCLISKCGRCVSVTVSSFVSRWQVSRCDLYVASMNGKPEAPRRKCALWAPSYDCNPG